jgi:hypothetical protein
MAIRFREGISYEDFVEFEKRLEIVDRVLEREARKLAQKLNE